MFQNWKQYMEQRYMQRCREIIRRGPNALRRTVIHGNVIDEKRFPRLAAAKRRLEEAERQRG